MSIEMANNVVILSQGRLAVSLSRRREKEISNRGLDLSVTVADRLCITYHCNDRGSISAALSLTLQCQQSDDYGFVPVERTLLVTILD